MKKYMVMIVVIVSILILSFSFYYIYSSNNSESDIDSLKSKVDKEIEYLDSTIIAIMNKFNNITYVDYKIVEEEVSASQEEQDNQNTSSQEKSSSSGSGGSSSSGGQQSGQSEDGSKTITNIDISYNGILVNNDNKVDWSYIKKEIEQMYGTWTDILIDLNALSLNRDNLLKYNSTLNNITQSLEKEDKNASLKNLADLYSLLVLYVREYSDDNTKISVIETKSNVLYAYALAENDNKWEEMNKYLKQAQNSYSQITNNGLQNSDNINTINKAYILLNELEKNTVNKEKNIFYINYKNLMQELELI